MPKYYQTIFNLFALAVIIFIGVELFYMIIRVQLKNFNTQGIITYHIPDVESHSQPTFDYYRPIMKRNIFGSGEDVSKEIRTEEIENLQPTSLKLALLGTVSGNRQNTFAVIEEIDKKKQALYRVGDSVQGAIVKTILRGKVILRVKERDEILTIEEAAALRAGKEYLTSEPIEAGDTIMVSRSAVQESMKNVHNLLSQVRIRPYFRDGKADGLSVTNIKAGSFFATLGLKNGDVVQGIDGKIIKSPEDVLEMYKKFKLGSQVELQIMRNNEQKIINYKFR
jgi:general secretion pathway protein C